MASFGAWLLVDGLVKEEAMRNVSNAIVLLVRDISRYPRPIVLCNGQKESSFSGYQR